MNASGRNMKGKKWKMLPDFTGFETPAGIRRRTKQRSVRKHGKERPIHPGDGSADLIY
jgi:hypothetical protein